MEDRLYDLPEICGTYFFPQPGGPMPCFERAGPVPLELPDGTPVAGYWNRLLDDAPTMLYLHGNGECIADQLGHWPEWARQAGTNIFFVDYPGYAASAGEPTFSSCRQAARAALDYLLSRPRSEVPAALVLGRSVGSIFALDVAAACADPRLRGLALESGIADLRPRLDMRLDYVRLGLDREELHRQVQRDFDHEVKVQRAGVPLLLLHTRHDSLVPVDNSELLARWAGEDLLHALVLFEQGDHNTIQLFNDVAYREALAGWVAACTGSSRA